MTEQMIQEKGLTAPRLTMDDIKRVIVGEYYFTAQQGYAGQQAEMLTDTIRALLLKAYGYETKVFEFVALEHTSKNKMILAVKRKDDQEPDQDVLNQIQALKEMYGIQKHSLELLLKDEWDQQGIGCKC